MSWISDNYEKAALGGAAVVALGCVAIIFSNKGAVDEVTALNTVKANNDVAILGQPTISASKASIDEEHSIAQYDLDGRKLNLITGVHVFAKKDDLTNPVDLHKSQPVHQGIDNDFWLKHKVDPGFSDSPEQDSDGDGFTNREEFIGKTDPNDYKSCPDLIYKLNVVGVKATQVHVKPSGFGNGKFTFKLQTKNGAQVNKMAPEPIAPGADIVFRGELMKSRFKFVKFEDRQVAQNGVNRKVRVWTLEDKKANKKGVNYEVDRSGNPGIKDSTVEFTLEALDQKGKSFKVEEKTKFTLPFGSKDSKHVYFLKEVDLANKKLEVEYLDASGKKKSEFFNFK